MNTTFDSNDTNLDDHENIVDLESYRDARFPDVDDILDRLTDHTRRAAGDTA